MKIIVALIIIALIVVGLWWYFAYKADNPSTQDAYVHAHVVNIAPEVSGRIESVNVKNFTNVKKGQLLFVILPKQYIAIANKANAELLLARRQVKAMRAAIKYAQDEVGAEQASYQDTLTHTSEIARLAKRGYASKQTNENAKTKLRSIKAKLQAAKSKLHQVIIRAGKKQYLNATIKKAVAILNKAKLDLGYTKIYAGVSF